MDTNELYLHYREAIQLVKVGRYEEAHHMLTEIDAERPGTKNVLYAIAVCCDMMGRTEEALDLCERLIAEHDHPKARMIKARIEAAAKEPDLPKVDLVSGLGLGAPKPPAPAAAQTPPPTPPAPPKKKAGWSFLGKKKK